jgi:hypothetical protein
MKQDPIFGYTLLAMDLELTYIPQLADPRINSLIHLAFSCLPCVVQVKTFKDNGVLDLLFEIREKFPEPSLVGTKGGHFLACEVHLP